jgi:hypothetical protein
MRLPSVAQVQDAVALAAIAAAQRELVASLSIRAQPGVDLGGLSGAQIKSLTIVQRPRSPSRPLAPDVEPSATLPKPSLASSNETCCNVDGPGGRGIGGHLTPEPSRSPPNHSTLQERMKMVGSKRQCSGPTVLSRDMSPLTIRR